VWGAMSGPPTWQASGGHFAALEEPAALAEDVRAFFRAFR